MKEEVIFENFTRFLKGREVEYDDPDVEGTKKIESLEWDELYNGVKVFLDDGTWAHLGFLILK